MRALKGVLQGTVPRDMAGLFLQKSYSVSESRKKQQKNGRENRELHRTDCVVCERENVEVRKGGTYEKEKRKDEGERKRRLSI